MALLENCVTNVAPFLLCVTGSIRPHSALGCTQPLTEMSTRDKLKIKKILGSRKRPVREADNLTVFCETIA
jgi:hypothetical protein